MRIAVFPGSFDPFTRGHAQIVARGLKLFDQIVIGVGYNVEKKGWIDVDERVRALQVYFSTDSRILVEKFNDLTVDFAARHNAQFILRGIRCVKDYEYELHLADINRQLGGIETVFLTASPEMAAVSSSTVRELVAFGHDIQAFIPEGLNYKQ